MSLITRSGQQMSPQLLLDTVRKIIRVGVRRAIITTVVSYNKHVAMEFGTLRTQLENMMANPVKFTGNRIIITFDIAEMALLVYALSHIDGKPHHPGDVTPYTNPFTAGTRPIQPLEFMLELEAEIIKEIYRGLRSYGL